MSLWRHAATAAMAATVIACAERGSSGEGNGGGSTAGTHLQGALLVSAAASLTDAFSELESVFEAVNPGVDVILNLGGSSSLRAQILEGAPVDVFASANTANMDRVADAGQVADRPHPFARSPLQIAVPANNPEHIEGLGDFADERLRLGLCAEAVPCGDLARRALARAGVVPSPDTNEPNVRALLSKIELGELDAGITYATDVASSRGAVQGIDIPADVNVSAEYSVAVLTGAPNPDVARAFVRFVLSAEGRSVLTKHGFSVP